ncbi:Synaptojanin-1 [Orbilia brochopaga]|nr:Synaptojanin-1 [Drechslerella brochopaga]
MAPSVPVYLFTFNCARQLINPDTVAPHLFAGLDPSAPPPVLLAIALQELCPLSYGLLAGDYVTPYLDQWTAVPHLASAAAVKLPSYSHVGRQVIGMTALLLFAAHPERVTNLRSAAVGFGPGRISNKGAVALRFTYSPPPPLNANETVDITIVSAHLAAHEHCHPQRNADWESLVRGLVFDASSTGPPAAAPHPSTSESTPLLSSGSTAPSPSGIYASGSHLLVLGDLNYRTSDTAPTSGDYASAFPRDAADLSAFLARDQLAVEKAAGNTLHGLVEAKITFPPTYKYTSMKPHTGDISSDEQSASVSNSFRKDDAMSIWAWAPHRWPSWCDRILWLPADEAGGVDVIPHRYTSISTITLSDHRPVTLHASLPMISAQSQREDIRTSPPFAVDVNWRVRRRAAEAREQLVGYAILVMTHPVGIAVVVCLVIGAVIFWWAKSGAVSGAV